MVSMEDRILNVLKQTLGLAQVDTTASQQTCAEWDSMNHLRLIIEIESEFDVSFEPEEIAELKSYDAIKNILEKKLK